MQLINLMSYLESPLVTPENHDNHQSEVYQQAIFYIG